MSINEVLNSYSENNSMITVRLLDDETVLIEGDTQGLRFLIDLLSALLVEDDEGFQFAPNGPGSIFFSKDSTLGLYLNRK